MRTILKGNDKNAEEIEEERAKWGKHVGEIARCAGTSYDLATIVGDIYDFDEAVNTLKEVKKILSTVKYFYDEHTIRDNLRFNMQIESYKKLNFCNKFFKAAEKIIKSNK